MLSGVLSFYRCTGAESDEEESGEEPTKNDNGRQQQNERTKVSDSEEVFKMPTLAHSSKAGAKSKGKLSSNAGISSTDSKGITMHL